MKWIHILLRLGITALPLLITFLTLATPTLSAKGTNESLHAQISSPLLQITVTPIASSEAITPSLEQIPASPAPNTITPTVELPTDIPARNFNITLNELGYEETTLNSPFDKTDFVFTLPINKDLINESFVEFDLSFVYAPIASTEVLPPNFGTISVKVDGQIDEKFIITEQKLEHFRFRVSIPASSTDQINSPTPERHRVEIFFDSGSCEFLHSSNLLIHPASSFFSLNLNETPLTLNLSDYPLPFYQRSFEPDAVLFNLPTQPTSAEASGAAGVAAKLGSLTGNRLVISSTLDIDLLEALSDPSATLDQHLIVIGQPQNNQILPFLNNVADLPVSLYERQMSLVVQGPESISKEELIDYRFTVTNTTDKKANLSLVDSLPAFTEFITCTPECESDDNDAAKVVWENIILDPNEAADFSLTLRPSETISEFKYENIVTLLEDELGPVNGNTLITTVGPNTDASEASSKTQTDDNENKYFFAVNNLAVAEGDGIVQAIVSPWNNNRAILIISGLNDKALKNASQAMSSSVRFPGMQGDFALIQESFPPEIEINQPTNTELTFEDLGENDQILRGKLTQRVNYLFFIPVGWKLTEDAFVDLQFSHAQPTPGQNAELLLLLNNRPIGNLPLSNETASNGQLKVNLPNSGIRDGQLNRLTVEISPYNENQGCATDVREFWFVAKNTSRISLDHNQGTNKKLDLNDLPFPFTNQPSLTDLLFALPDLPTTNEWENTLRLAAAMGNIANGRTILPNIIMDFSNLSEDELDDYQIIAIGRPSRNALLQKISSDLPQPFLPNSDIIHQQLDDVTVRLPVGASLGYLQLLPSPWSQERAILAVTGTTDEGVMAAAEVVYQGRSRIRGNLALIQNEGIESTDTRRVEISASTAPTATPDNITSTRTVTSTSVALVSAPEEKTSTPPANTVSVPPEPEPNLPGWLILLVSITVVIVLGIFVFVFTQSRRQRQ